mgnify:FL=1
MNSSLTTQFGEKRMSEGALKEIERSLEPKLPIQIDTQVIQLTEKLRIAIETFDAIKLQLDKLDILADDLLKRSREVNVAEAMLYRKLADVLPKVVADMK